MCHQCFEWQAEGWLSRVTQSSLACNQFQFESTLRLNVAAFTEALQCLAASVARVGHYLRVVDTRARPAVRAVRQVTCRVSQTCLPTLANQKTFAFI